jgi:transketolase
VNAEAKTTATRLSSLASIEGYAKLLPEIFGGSADLGCSNMTEWTGYKPMRADKPNANYVNYGVREFGMSAIMNGVALHGGLVPFGATFLMFSEYARNAVRMASLMKIRSIFVYTHDSIGLGEDGPTHQPVEQTATLRLIPGMHVWRTCDAVETAVAWRAAIERKDGPSVLVFSRQNLPHVPRTDAQISAITRGGYILVDSEGTPDAIIIATGSEVELAVKAAEQLKASGKNIRVVSMPSTNIFDAQDAAYKESVLPSSVTQRVAVEAGVTDGWWKYVGTNGRIVGIDHFGESAPAGQLFKEFGFTVENVVLNVEAVL